MPNLNLRPFLAITASLLVLPPQTCHASTITVGTMNTKDQYPFGLTSSHTAAYLGEYQQVYASTLFSSPVVISQIAFATYFPYAGTANYTLSVGLGVTPRTPGAPGNQFAGGWTTVFSGSTVAHLTSTHDDFDFLINFTTPYTYDPAQGNLLLDVQVFSASGGSGSYGTVFDVEWSSSVMGRLWSSGDTVSSVPNEGLVTQFTVAATPALTAGLTATNLNLSWPTNVSGFRLQSSTNLSSTTSWITVTNAVRTVGTNYSVNLTAESGYQFFRLVR